MFVIHFNHSQTHCFFLSLALSTTALDHQPAIPKDAVQPISQPIYSAGRASPLPSPSYPELKAECSESVEFAGSEISGDARRRAWHLRHRLFSAHPLFL